MKTIRKPKILNEKQTWVRKETPNVILHIYGVIPMNSIITKSFTHTWTSTKFIIITSLHFSESKTSVPCTTLTGLSDQNLWKRSDIIICTTKLANFELKVKVLLWCKLDKYGNSYEGIIIQNKLEVKWRLYLKWTSGSTMDLIVDHVLQTLVVGWTKEDLSVHFASGVTVVHHL